MKVYFGESLDEMIREIGARGTETVRVHAVAHDEPQEVRVDVHATTLCGGQIYESVKTSYHSVDGEGEERRKRIAELCEERREKVAETCSRFEIRRGILKQ